jgi:hypothetical protein
MSDYTKISNLILLGSCHKVNSSFLMFLSGPGALNDLRVKPPKTYDILKNIPLKSRIVHCESIETPCNSLGKIRTIVCIHIIPLFSLANTIIMY